jgi:hypothetical protein
MTNPSSRNNPELRRIGTVRNKEQQLLTVYKGLNDDIRQQIGAKSHEEEIAARCPKDALSRFRNANTFAAWEEKDRTVYTAQTASGEVDGLIWFGPEVFTGEAYKADATPQALALGQLMTDTYAIRVYESASRKSHGIREGSGIAKNFTLLTTIDYARERIVEGNDAVRPSFTGIHLETDMDNWPARAVYARLGGEFGGQDNGYLEIGDDLARGRVAMALPRPLMGSVLGIEVR